MLQLLLSLVILAATIFTVINVITSDSPRYLPKIVWVLLVVFVPLIGIFAWWLVGRDRETTSFEPARYEATRMPVRPTPVVDDDEDIDAAVEREIAFHENEARIRRLEREVEARKSSDAV